MEEIEELRAELGRLRRLLAPNEDPSLTRALRAYFSSKDGSVQMDKYSYTGHSRQYCYKMTAREVAEETRLGKDPQTIYLIGQSMMVLGWRRVTIGGRPHYRITVEEYDNEFLPKLQRTPRY